MRKLFYILLFLPLLCSAENRQSKVDSLQLILAHAHLDTNNVLSRIELSTQLYEMDSYSEAMEQVLEAKALSDKLGFKSGIASSLRRIGAIQTEIGKYPQAIESLLSSLHIYESIKSAEKIASVNNSLGTTYYFMHNYKMALEYYFKAYAYKNRDALTCANLGMVYGESGDFVLAKHFLSQALDIYQATNNQNGISLMLNNIGCIYEYELSYKNALEYYFKALKIKETIKDYKGMSECLGSIGDVFLKTNKHLLALKYETECLSISRKIGYLNNISITENKISEIYTALHQCDKALEHYKLFTIAKDSMFNEENTRKTVSSEKDFEFQKKEELLKAEQDKKDAISIEVKERQRIIIYSISGGLFLVLLLVIFIFRGYKQKQKSNIFLEEKNKIIIEKNKEITDNINYAKRIQDAVMTPTSQIKEHLPSSFLLNKARDIVSGDFVFMEIYKGEIIVAVADCTNHSVSGSLMTILCHNLLSEAVTLGINAPADILNYVNSTISKKFHQTDGNTKKESDIVKDGMDLVLIKLDLENMKYQFAGAYNPLLIVRNNELIEIKADKLQMGQTKIPYNNNYGTLQKNDIIYMSSDGYADQFSSNGKKFMKKRFKELLISISETPITEQCLILEETIESWKSRCEQTDDILVMGIKI